MGSPEIPIVIGLSILLIKLLSKTFTWPPAANKITFIDQLYSSAYIALENEPISSDLRILLNAIFSKTDFNDIFYQNEYIKVSDEIKISGINDYLSLLRKIQDKLKKSHWNVIDREPRQLVYINLDDLNKSSNFFFDTL